MSDVSTGKRIWTRWAASCGWNTGRGLFRNRPVRTGSEVRHRIVLLLVVVLASGNGEVSLAQKKVGPARLAVDLVTLSSGERFRGAFAGVDDDGVVSMAVQRSWLKKTRLQIYERVTRNETAEAKAALTEMRRRIESWLAEKPSANALVAFLEVELERVSEQVARMNERREEALSSQFVMLTFPRHQVKYSFAQASGNRRLALLAWRERFDDVETREARELEEQLRALGIDPAAETPDLADRFPTVRQDDNEWAARRAVIEFDLVGKLEFQGIGKALVRTDGGAAEAGLETLLPELLPQLLQDQLGGPLAELLQEPGVKLPRGRKNSMPDFTKAIREAEQEGVRGFRVTTVALNLNRQQADVETTFLAKMPGGKWESIWSHKAVRDPASPRPGLKQQIENDPQVADAIRLAKSLGLVGGNQLETAMSFGAATMDAQKAADREFFRFLDRYVRHLDGPRLSWKAGSPSE